MKTKRTSIIWQISIALLSEFFLTTNGLGAEFAHESAAYFDRLLPEARDLSFVGQDEFGTEIAVVMAGPANAVGMIHDGRGNAAWLFGTYDGTTRTLKMQGGGTELLAEMTGGHLRGYHGVLTRTDFQLHKALRYAGLYRNLDRYDGIAYSTGWIVDNDGHVYAAGYKGGEETSFVVATSNPKDDPDSVGADISNTTPTAYATRVRCAILSGRLQFNREQLADATDPDDVADANADIDRIKGKMVRLGCEHAILPFE